MICLPQLFVKAMDYMSFMIKPVSINLKILRIPVFVVPEHAK
jgi:hypothetical protein